METTSNNNQTIQRSISLTDEQKKKINELIEHYQSVTFDRDLCDVGGGLSDRKAVSRRHELASSDEGKLTLGEFASLVARILKRKQSEISKAILYTYPNLEWHHAGFIPGARKMAETYFVNAGQIVDFCKNIERYIDDFERYKQRKEVEDNEYIYGYYWVWEKERIGNRKRYYKVVHFFEGLRKDAPKKNFKEISKETFEKVKADEGKAFYGYDKPVYL